MKPIRNKVIEQKKLTLDTMLKNPEFPHTTKQIEPYSYNIDHLTMTITEKLIGYEVTEVSDRRDATTWNFYYSDAKDYYDKMVDFYLNIEGYEEKKDCDGCDSCTC